jgi:hypothetical protein
MRANQQRGRHTQRSFVHSAWEIPRPHPLSAALPPSAGLAAGWRVAAGKQMSPVFPHRAHGFRACWKSGQRAAAAQDEATKGGDCQGSTGRLRQRSAGVGHVVHSTPLVVAGVGHAEADEEIPGGGVVQVEGAVLVDVLELYRLEDRAIEGQDIRVVGPTIVGDVYHGDLGSLGAEDGVELKGDRVGCNAQQRHRGHGHESIEEDGVDIRAIIVGQSHSSPPFYPAILAACCRPSRHVYSHNITAAAQDAISPVKYQSSRGSAGSENVKELMKEIKSIDIATNAKITSTHLPLVRIRPWRVPIRARRPSRTVRQKNSINESINGFLCLENPANGSVIPATTATPRHIKNERVGPPKNHKPRKT